ncbi:MAG: Trm112 family protein [Pirellulales bacterium]
MISPDLIRMLVCPETRRPLAAADAELVARINAAVRTGRLRDRSGQYLSRPIEAGLLRDDGEVVYPVVDGIPNLLVDRAIERSALDRAAAEAP